MRQATAKTKILDAALSVIRSKGYSATTVDDLCEAAGVTKGAFFHHFKSKEELGVAAARHWSEVTNALFAAAPYRKPGDPLERLLAYLDFRKALLQGKTAEYTCLVGTVVQETFDSVPAVRDACQASIFGHSADVAKDIEEAKRLYAPDSAWSAMSLALHIQSVIQGSFVLAKADSASGKGAERVAESIDQLRRYLELLFKRPQTRSRKGKK